MCGISLNPQLNLTSGSTPNAQGSDNPVQVDGTDVYEFTGTKSLSAFSVVQDSVKNDVFSTNDQFSVSVWVYVEDISGLQYIFSFEDSTRDRHFSWLLREARLNIFYTRDRLNGLDDSQLDQGVGSRVGMSFYFVEALGGALKEDEWYFFKLDVSNPSIKLYVNGYLHEVTEGHYFDIADERQDLSSPYEMPAPLWENNQKLSDIKGYIGGSRRGNGAYNFDGKLRLLFFTGLMDNSQYTCIASCNNSLIPPGYVPGNTDFNASIGNFDVFYQPVSRSLYFVSSNLSVSTYDSFVKSLIYHTNGYLPAQQEEGMGEGRRVKIQVRV